MVRAGRLLVLCLEGARDFPANSNPVSDDPRELSLMAVGTKLLLFGS